MSSPAGRIRHRVVRIEETLRRLLGRGGCGAGDFRPWPATAQEEAQWHRATAELEALIERLDEASAAELDGAEMLLKRLEGERVAEESRMARARSVLFGAGTSHGRLPLASECACGCCEDFRRA